MIGGLRTILYPAPDLAKGKAFYTAVLGAPPYFDEPYYVGFEVGGFELGLVPDAIPGSHGAVAYWAVEDTAAEYQRLLGLGAAPHEAPQDVGGGIQHASVLDPFGNVFGLLLNPHFDRNKVR